MVVQPWITSVMHLHNDWTLQHLLSGLYVVGLPPPTHLCTRFSTLILQLFWLLPWQAQVFSFKRKLAWCVVFPIMMLLLCCKDAMLVLVGVSKEHHPKLKNCSFTRLLWDVTMFAPCVRQGIMAPTRITPLNNATPLSTWRLTWHGYCS